MQVFKFDYNSHNSPAYGCDKPGDNSGLYLKYNDVSVALSMSSQAIRLMAGEMTAQEMRTVKAVLAAIKSKISMD